jgi:Carboxypeptidase regulatory-like domain
LCAARRARKRLVINARYGRATSVRLLTAVLVLCTISVAQAAEQYKGRPLIDALRALQAQGLRIVFSTATVTPDLRVQSEPRATGARQRLDQLLAPHGLIARDGPGGIIEIVRADARVAESSAAVSGTIEGWVIDASTAVRLRDVVIRVNGETGDTRTDAAGRFLLRRVPAGARLLLATAAGYTASTRAIQVTGGTTTTITLSLFPVPNTLYEYVSVRVPAPNRLDQGVASETSLDRSQLEGLYGSLADDPVRAVHAFPRVTPVDEFRSEFAVRGSAFRHVDLVVDGISTHWLQHTAYGRAATGSVPMLAGQVLEDVTLRAGAYPRRFGDRLGAQLELTTREGSRTRFMLHGAVSGTNAMVLAEGPLGRSARGSWLVAARQSYLEWPTERAESTRTAFGFSDGLAKLVYDVRPNQQVAVSVVGGMSNIDVEDDLAPNELGNGWNRAAVVNISWRSMFGSAFVRQRAYVVRQHFVNKHQSGLASDRGANKEVMYRADITRRFAMGLLEGGAQVGKTTIADVPRSVEAHSISASSWQRSGYAHLAWAVMPALTLSPGVRVTTSTITPHPSVSRWLLGEWVFGRRWTFNASTGVSQQQPELRYVRGEAGSLTLRPERANYIDVGIEQRLTNSIRWQATVFSRNERDILRIPEIYPRIVGDVLVFPEHEHYANALQGRSRGIELVLDRRSPIGFSGWASYSYGKIRYSDRGRQETFWGDFDQRHSLNLFVTHRFSNRSSIGGTFRAGSNFPIPAYLTTRDGGLFAAAVRNHVRLPSYARLDLRADRAFEHFGRRLTLFFELLNALNRANLGLAGGSVNPATGEAIGFTDALYRRRASAGISVDF